MKAGSEVADGQFQKRGKFQDGSCACEANDLFPFSMHPFAAGGGWAPFSMQLPSLSWWRHRVKGGAAAHPAPLTRR